MTRYDKISPPWQNFKSIWPFLEGLFGIWQSVAPTLGIFLCFWAHFYWCTWRNFEQIMQPSGHTGRNPIRVDTRKLFTYLLSTDGQIQIKDYLPRLISKLGRRVNSQRRVVRLGRLRPIHR